MHWFIDPIKNHYADFTGRATRKQFWMFTLVYTLLVLSWAIVCVLVAFTNMPIAGDSFADADFDLSGVNIALLLLAGTVLVLFMVAVTIPQIALQVRRLHDAGYSGYWYFIGFIPWIGGLIIAGMSCIPSQSGTNKWGDNPHGVGTVLSTSQNVLAVGTEPNSNPV